MFAWLERAVRNMFAATTRVILIFLLLSIGLDAMTRIYYSYMPIETWMDFTSLEVKMLNGEAVGIVGRRPKGQSLSIFHRTLLIRYPDEVRGCTNSTVTIIEDQTAASVVIPISRMLSPTCPEVLHGEKVDAVLQAAYIFEFPYGVKRLAVKLSNRFSIQYIGDRYVIGAPTQTSGIQPIRPTITPE